MNTLSNDNTLFVSTAGLNTGYVQLAIYANGIGVFSGRTYVDGVAPTVNVYMNDFMVLNRAKYDYIKLNDNGEVETLPIIAEHGYTSRFQYGQIRLYAAALIDPTTAPTTVNTSTMKILAGYDYPNKDLKPNVIDDDGAQNDIVRVMQGCYWVADHDVDEGSFANLLLPHYPAIDTKKYGFGLHIQDKKGNVSFALTAPDTANANEFVLGQAQAMVGLSSAQTFVSLYDLIHNQTLNDGDTPIYLKHTGTTGDEFGYYDNNVLLYYYTVESVNAIRATYYEADSGEYLETVDYHFDGNDGVTYLQRYITAATNNLDPTSKYYNLDYWTIERIVDQGKPVYNNSSDVWQTSEESSADGTAYANFYTRLRVESLIANTKVFIQPLFSGTTNALRKTSFMGTCPVAILDKCYSRYYLAWNDRYGDIMSQPFDGKFNYSENFEREEVKDYKLRRRVSRNEVQPTWTLNTKWLNEDVYPMYEAIFTSPYLLLYDTETNRSWNVILNDTDYKEKTFKNEKKLFNLEITVEANLKENYIF